MELDCEIIEPKIEEILIIDSEEESSKETQQHKNVIISSDKNTRTRKVTICTDHTVNNSSEKLIITQKVKMINNKIKCVINLNANVCDSNACQSNLESKLSEDKYRSKKSYRIVPECCRKKCAIAIRQKKASNSKRWSEKQKNKCIKHKRKHRCRKKHKKKKKDSKNSKPDLDLSLSSLSSISLSEPPWKYQDMIKEISYEDISPDSFTSDGEIDKLIKKAKDREYITTVDGSLGHPIRTSTPYIIEISSDGESNQSDVNRSMHSVSTVMIDPQLPPTTIYSPSMSFSEPQNIRDIMSYPKKDIVMSIYESKNCTNLIDVELKCNNFNNCNKQLINKTNPESIALLLL